MEEPKISEDRRALDTLFTAAGMAALNRAEHAAVQAAAQRLADFISKCEACDKVEPVEVVTKKEK